MEEMTLRVPVAVKGKSNKRLESENLYPILKLALIW